MMACPMRERIVHCILITLLSGFFAIPLIALFLNQPKFLPGKQIASILLFFFR